MEHKEIKSMISPYIDNMLDSTQMKKVEEHLESCSVCKKEYEELLFMKEVLNNIPEAELAEGFDEKLRASIANTEQVKPKKIRKSFVAAAAVLMLGLLSVLSFDGIVDTVLPDGDSGTKVATEENGDNTNNDGNNEDGNADDKDSNDESDSDQDNNGSTQNGNDSNSNQGTNSTGGSNNGNTLTPNGDLNWSNNGSNGQENNGVKEPETYSAAHYKNLIASALSGYQYSCTLQSSSSGVYVFAVTVTADRNGEPLHINVTVTGKNGKISPHQSAWGVPGL